jgi:nucleoside phosphorylase
MEAYSIAKSCLVKGVKFEIWKYVSDTADESAGTEWKNSVSLGQEHYMKVLEDLSVNLIEGDLKK